MMLPKPTNSYLPIVKDDALSDNACSTHTTYINVAD
jgi:hypothetical protein